MRSIDIVDGQVLTADLANNAVTSDKIRDGEVKPNDLDPSLTIGGQIGLQVTERHSSIELPRTRGEFTARVECNPDEVVTGGGFAASLSPQFTSPTGIPKESRKAFNGWEVHWDVAGWGDGSSHPQYAPAMVQVFAECLKVLNQGTTG